MKSFYKLTTLILLLINSTGAFYGGVSMIIKPDGSAIGLDPELLQKTPFENFLFPGVILICVNGLLSLFVFVTILVKHPAYPLFIIAQGAVLTGWIIIQVILIDTVYFLHYIMGSIGLILILIGRIQYTLISKSDKPGRSEI